MDTIVLILTMANILNNQKALHKPNKNIFSITSIIKFILITLKRHILIFDMKPSL